MTACTHTDACTHIPISQRETIVIVALLVFIKTKRLCSPGLPSACFLGREGTWAP